MRMSKFKVGDKVKIIIETGKFAGMYGVIKDMDTSEYGLYIGFMSESDDDLFWFEEGEIELSTSDQVESQIQEKLYFEKLGTEIGNLVDTKQQAYGDSVSKTYKLMQIFLEQYENEDNTYTIPKSLLKHILLQVRMIDKQNRIFSNPDGDLMQENPYQDSVGYSMLGVRMCEQNK